MITKRNSIATNEETNIQIPSLDSKDTIMYISRNPQNSSEMVFATMKANVFLSTRIAVKRGNRLLKRGHYNITS